MKKILFFIVFLIGVNVAFAIGPLGKECEANTDCESKFCFFCPDDTVMHIQLGNRYDPHVFWGEYKDGRSDSTMSPGMVSDPYEWGVERYCSGKWNNDKYDVQANFDYYGLSYNRELTKDSLDKWKSIILGYISENYYNEHFDVIYIKPLINDERDNAHTSSLAKGDKLYVHMVYRFKYGWYETNETNVFIIKKYNDSWFWANDEEIESSLIKNAKMSNNLPWFNEFSGSIVDISYVEELVNNCGLEINEVKSRWMFNHRLRIGKNPNDVDGKAVDVDVIAKKGMCIDCTSRLCKVFKLDCSEDKCSIKQSWFSGLYWTIKSELLWDISFA